MIYLATPNTNDVRLAITAGKLGALIQPDSWSSENRPHIQSWPWWAADNACFCKGCVTGEPHVCKEFDADAWLGWLGLFTDHLGSCLFAVLPDVVGEAEGTLLRSTPYIDTVRAMGYPVAYVAQEGVSHYPPPWDDIDAIFIGGLTEEFKFGEGLTCALEGKARGLWTHMGRVNSFRRLRSASLAGIQSADGTYLAFGPDTNLPKLLRWLEWIDRHEPLGLEAV